MRSVLALAFLFSTTAAAQDAAPVPSEPATPAAPEATPAPAEAKAAEVTSAEMSMEVAPPPVEVTAPPKPAPEEPKLAAGACPKGTLLCFTNGPVAIWPKVRIRPGFEYVDADPAILYIGQNDGFFLDQARIGAEGDIAGLAHFKLTIETASLLAGAAPNAPVTPLVAAARDAWVAWTPSQWFIMQVGQQPMPADFESGDIEAILPFTSRSVASGGVRAGHGFATVGLSPQRQVGIVVGSADGHAIGDIPVEYRLAIANGNGQNLLGNDNKLPAAYLRLGSGFSELVKVGVGGRLNPRTTGSLPNLYAETDVVGFADATVKIAGLSLVLEGMARQTSLVTLVPDPANAAGTETGWGTTAWLAYRIDFPSLAPSLPNMAISPAYRFSMYEPSSAFLTDSLMENTIGVRIDGDRATMPLAFFLDYTILTEMADIGQTATTRDIADNRLTAFFQLEL